METGLRHQWHWLRGFSLLPKPVQLDLLLLEISPVFFIDKDQVQHVFHAEPVADILVGGCQVIGGQEQPAFVKSVSGVS